MAKLNKIVYCDGRYDERDLPDPRLKNEAAKARYKRNIKKRTILGTDALYSLRR